MRQRRAGRRKQQQRQRHAQQRAAAASERARAHLVAGGLAIVRRGCLGFDSQVLMILKFRGDELTCFAGMALRRGGEEHEWQQQPYDCRHLVCLVSSGGLHAFVCSEFETEKPGETKLQEA